jgi:uncharacterized protein YprB with RNaseH-like and TPR domain
MRLETFLESGPLMFDIETTGLKADYGLILVIGVRRFLPEGSPEAVQFVIDRTRQDWEAAERVLLRSFLSYMKDESCIITFNGTRFDMPFLQARLAIQGLPLMPKMHHLDMFYAAKNAFRYTITSRRAKYLQALYSVGDPSAPHKESSQVMTWLRATYSRNRAAFNRIVAHNRTECLVSLDYQVRKLRPVLPRSVSLR